MRADTMRAALVLALSTIYAAAVHPKGAAFSARGGVRATSASCPAPPGGTAARGGDAGVVVVDGFLAPDDVARLRAQTGWLDASFLGLRPNTTPERHFVVDAAPAVAARLRSAVYAALGSVDDGSAPAQTRLPARTIYGPAEAHRDAPKTAPAWSPGGARTKGFRERSRRRRGVVASTPRGGRGLPARPNAWFRRRSRDRWEGANRKDLAAPLKRRYQDGYAAVVYLAGEGDLVIGDQVIAAAPGRLVAWNNTFPHASRGGIRTLLGPVALLPDDAAAPLWLTTKGCCGSSPILLMPIVLFLFLICICRRCSVRWRASVVCCYVAGYGAIAATGYFFMTGGAVHESALATAFCVLAGIGHLASAVSVAARAEVDRVASTSRRRSRPKAGRLRRIVVRTGRGRRRRARRRVVPPRRPARRLDPPRRGARAAGGRGRRRRGVGPRVVVRRRLGGGQGPRPRPALR
jgi:hypothetical protein